MEKIERRKALWRFPLAVTIILTLFWGVWYILIGKVPESFKLSFAISRLWDIAFAPICIFLVIFLSTCRKTTKNEDIIDCLVSSLIIGQLTCLIAGVPLGMFMVLCSYLIFWFNIRIWLKKGNGKSFPFFLIIYYSVIFYLKTRLPKYLRPCILIRCR